MARWQDYILRGTRAAQPNSTSTTIGTLYCVTDESDKIERWSGMAWESYSVTVAGFGDVFGPAASVDSEITLFSGTTGKLLKRATGTGVVHATSGVYSVASVNLATEVTGTLPVANGGTGIASYTQGDTLYASGTTTLSTLAKDTNATRYLSNTGATNNPAWAQVNLANGVSGDLPFANLTPATAGSLLLGRGSSGAGDFQEITLGSNLSISGTVISASTGSAGTTINQTNGFRLTLATGQPVYVPLPATPSSTDTTNEIVTFTSDPGWYNGTIVTPASTLAGLTAGTTYYIHRITSTTYSFHTTVAAAMSGTSRVNLTASVTQQINPSGISATGIYFTPYLGDTIALFNGYTWVITALSEMSVGLGTLSANTNYDLFLDYNGGSPVLSIGTAWSSDSVRAVALVRQDGVLVSSADAESRYVGTFRTDSTTTTIDDAGGIITQIGGKRFLFNATNRRSCYMAEFDSTASWTDNSTTFRQANSAGGANGNKLDFVAGLNEDGFHASYMGYATSPNNSEAIIGVALNVSTAIYQGEAGMAIGTTNISGSATAMMHTMPTLGLNTIYPIERASAAVNVTFFGSPDYRLAATIFM